MERKNAGSKNGGKISDEINRFLTEIYYDSRNPASYSGIQKLYSYVRDQTKKKITKNKLGNGLVNRRSAPLIYLSGGILRDLQC